MGSVVMSIDAELGWGFHDVASPPPDRLAAARRGWRQLVDLLDEYRVPATWAVVGHLFLAGCDGEHAAHPTALDWFERERTSWRDRPDLRFAPELVADVLGARVDHDVGSHTFSHVDAGEPWVDREVFLAELVAANEAAGSLGVEPRSFVFPRNVVGFRETLAEAGLDVYRGPRRLPEGGLARSFGKLVEATDPERARLVQPSVDEHGLVEVPPSLYLYGFEGLARTVVESVWTDPVVAQAKHGIERAARTSGVFHVWLHPNNLVDARDVRRLRAVLEHISRLRRTGGLVVETMADVADRIR